MSLFNKFFKSSSLFSKALHYRPIMRYHFPEASPGGVQRDPGLTAKRIIKCVGERLRVIDPARWENVPITFKTHFRDEDGYSDVATCIHIHEALEREFGIEIKDRQILISDIETAFSIVMHSHEAL